MKTLIILICLTMVGCLPPEPNKEVATIHIGEIIEVTETRINEYDSRSVVITNVGIFQVEGLVSFMYGDTANLVIYSNGDKYFCPMNLTTKCLKVY